MTMSRARMIHGALVAALAGALFACARATEAPGTGGETHWLACDTDDDCSGELRCREGMCVDRTLADGSDASMVDPGSSDIASDVPVSPIDSGVELPGLFTLDQLEACPGSGPTRTVLDLVGALCDQEPCPAQDSVFSVLSVLEDGDLLLRAWALDESGGDASSLVELRTDGRLGPLMPLPELARGHTLRAAGSYVASYEDVLESDGSPGRITNGALFEWHDGALTQLEAAAPAQHISGRGARTVVSGTAAPGDEPRHAWLAALDGSSQRWHIRAPIEDAEAYYQGRSDAVAVDDDGSVSWLVSSGTSPGIEGRIQWDTALVRIDAEGNHAWTESLDSTYPESTERPALGLTAAGGVTTLVGGVYLSAPLEQPLDYALALHQLDREGTMVRSWRGFPIEHIHSERPLPIVADDAGNVYVALHQWPASTRTGVKILRFAPSGDPCLLAELEDEQVGFQLHLRGSRILFSGLTTVVEVPL